MSRPEILAPAGNREMLGAAVFSGADAVYLGLTGFNARRTAGNFTPDELREAVAFCHARGVKVHVTLNTLVYDRELSGLADAVRAVAAAGADAVIADDLATAQLVKSIAPTLHLHGSTQMSVHTPEGAKELAALGYDRVILARELSLEEIRAVCEASPIEVEVFVQCSEAYHLGSEISAVFAYVDHKMFVVTVTTIFACDVFIIVVALAVNTFYELVSLRP